MAAALASPALPPEAFPDFPLPDCILKKKKKSSCLSGLDKVAKAVETRHCKSLGLLESWINRCERDGDGGGQGCARPAQ